MGFSVTIASTIVLIGVIILFGSLSAVLVYSLNTLSDTAKEYFNRERDKLDVRLELNITSIEANSCIINVKNLGTKTIFLQSQENFQWNSIMISYQNAVRTRAPWLSGWDQRVKIMIDHNDVDSALSNFPVLIYLSNSSSGYNNDDASFVFDELQSDANRKKIAVTTSDGTTQCYVEIEKWDNASEQAWLWVKVPSISNTTDTDFYLYYDADHADNTDYVGDPNSTPAENVWDINYVLVWHMSEDGDVIDSTSNNNNGTVTGLSSVAGKIGYAKNSSGGSNGIASLNTIALGTGQFTVEGWFNPNVYTTDWIGLFGPKHPTDDYNEIMWPNNGKWGYWDDSVTVTSNQPIVAGQWDYYVVVREGTGSNQLRNYINGSYDNAGTSAYDFPAQPIWLGKSSTYPWNGISDELRISNVSRSAAWIKASYESERDDLVDFGSEEDENFHWLSYIIEDYTVLEVNVTDTHVSFNPASHKFINPGEEARISFSLPEEASAIPEGVAVIIVFASHYGVTAQAEGVR